MRAVTARYKIRHTLEHEYSAPVSMEFTSVFMEPIRDRRQVVHEFSLETEPRGGIHEFDGPFEGRGHFFDRPAPHSRLSITARSHVEIFPDPPLPESVPGGWDGLRESINRSALWIMLQPSQFVRPGPQLTAFEAESGIERQEDPLQSALALNSHLFGVFEYLPGATLVDSPIEDVLESRQGVCQDYAHVMSAILRGWGIPTRHVSGYLCDPAVAEQQECEAHAWVESWFPGIGWVGLDPANDSVADLRHVRVAVGRDYSDVPPSRGVFTGVVHSSLRPEVLVSAFPGREVAEESFYQHEQ